MSKAKQYTDLKGRSILLADLDTQEREIVRGLMERAQTPGDWNDYSNYWLSHVGGFYSARGLGREETRRTAVYRIAQDLGSRLALKAGLAQPPDYRDDLAGLVSSRFATRRQFCEATGLSEDMLSHVLAKRKHLAIDTLTSALARIGYTIHIAPVEETSRC